MRLLPVLEHPELHKQYVLLRECFLKEQNQNPSQINPESKIFLFEYDSKIVGFAEVHLEEECFPDEDLPQLCLHIHAFYIQSDKRQHGLGSMAFKLVSQWGRDNGAALVEIEAETTVVSANKFLDDLGLDLVGKGLKNIYRGFI
jgi:GNAT superfamily N-acetyltransferase